MKYLLLLCLLLFSSLFFTVSAQDTIKQSEKIFAEMSANISYYNSLSISMEKEFTYGKFTFGPRVELLNLFNTQTYEGGDTTFTMNTQVRLRLVQIEYRLNEYVKLGVAPLWLLGPLPRNGYYKTPSSVYAHVQLKEGLSLETSFTISDQEMVQISLRKVL
jgi:hypothetical protein